MRCTGWCLRLEYIAVEIARRPHPKTVGNPWPWHFHKHTAREAVRAIAVRRQSGIASTHVPGGMLLDSGLLDGGTRH